MAKNLLKTMTLWSISKGFRLPQVPVDRINELAFLRDLFRQLSIDCVLDVGANRGQFASELRDIGYEGKIYSFEPISSEFEVMKARFRHDPNWIGYQFALGSTSTSMLVTIPALTVMSSLLESIVPEKGVRQEMVEVKRLDSILSSHLKLSDANRVFLKMDTQGFDLEVFRGAGAFIDRVLGIQSELSIQPLYKGMPHYVDVLQIYEAAGFDLYNLSVVNRIESGGLLEMNGLMRRSSKL